MKIGPQNFIFEMAVIMSNLFSARFNSPNMGTFPCNSTLLPLVSFDLEVFVLYSFFFFYGKAKILGKGNSGF